MIDLDQYNDDVRKWGASFVKLTRTTGQGMGIKHEDRSPSKKASLLNLKDRYRISSGAINKVSVSLARSLMYTVKGAGKGIGGSKGSRWTNSKGQNKKTKLSSLGKLGSGSRTPKDFISAALDSPEGVNKLADIAAGGMGSAVIDNIYIK